MKKSKPKPGSINMVAVFTSLGAALLVVVLFSWYVFSVTGLPTTDNIGKIGDSFAIVSTLLTLGALVGVVFAMHSNAEANVVNAIAAKAAVNATLATYYQDFIKNNLGGSITENHPAIMDARSKLADTISELQLSQDQLREIT